MLDPDDHRSLIQRLDLCHFEDQSPGMVHWHPRGYVLYRLLEGAARTRTEADGYSEVRTPQLVRRPVWDASGHWNSFGAGMFRLHDGSFEAALKPVSCPGHIHVAKQTVDSYRNLPLRLSEFGVVHRDEPGGTLHGLLRLRQFTQDDGHVFCREDQVDDELDGFCRTVRPFYAAFGFTSLEVAVSTRPNHRGGEDTDWDYTERALRSTLDRAGIAYAIQEGAGAFYGPKIEFSLTDRSGRAWQCGTIQLDVLMPRRFELRYQSSDGERRFVVMLHRALYGSLERFLGLLLERHRGALPLWIAPEQVRVLPVASQQHEYAHQVQSMLTDAGLRVHVDEREETLSRRVLGAHEAGVRIMGIVGEQERGRGAVTLREGESQRVVPLAAATEELRVRCMPPDFRTV